MLLTFQVARRTPLTLRGRFARTPRVQAWVDAARGAEMPVVASSASLVEALNPRADEAAAQWSLSRVVVEPLTDDHAPDAHRLLRRAKRHGHEHAIDAMVCATALSLPTPVTILTSDPDDLRLLLQEHPQILVEKV